MAYLASATLQIDVFIATDVFNCFGEIGPILRDCRNRQGVCGLLAFSVEAIKNDSSQRKKRIQACQQRTIPT
jgi:predicted TPR repeat methyltransferase